MYYLLQDGGASDGAPSADSEGGMRPPQVRRFTGAASGAPRRDSDGGRGVWGGSEGRALRRRPDATRCPIVEELFLILFLLDGLLLHLGGLDFRARGARLDLVLLSVPRRAHIVLRATRRILVLYEGPRLYWILYSIET